ncbi:MAG: ATP-binding cassette domain-containing protein [Candidatus Zixiibacteriota bacterium]|nr:MAG: ATP-binding cassette domain-containing protein [candidate division Zixibacteria bacterium]
MIQLRNVSFSYGDKAVLQNISFSIEDRESAVIMGPSGSGKSTILRLILGLLNPSEGEVLINGQNISAMPEKHRRRIRKNIGMVFQDGALFDSLTVGENVGYYLLEHTKMTWAEISDAVRQMLGFVDLDADEVGDKLPEHLSGGQQRRVAIGRALLSTDPRIMLYDEPTTGLDPYMTDTVLALINKLKEEKNVSTIAVTHQVADALQLANRFIVIIDGRVAFDGNCEQLRDSKDLDVLQFLAPFRISVSEVTKRKFIPL